MISSPFPGTAGDGLGLGVACAKPGATAHNSAIDRRTSAVRAILKGLNMVDFKAQFNHAEQESYNQGQDAKSFAAKEKWVFDDEHPS